MNSSENVKPGERHKFVPVPEYYGAVTNRHDGSRTNSTDSSKPTLDTSPRHPGHVALIYEERLVQSCSGIPKLEHSSLGSMIHAQLDPLNTLLC